MRRLATTFAILALLSGGHAFADAFSNLLQSEAKLVQATSWHAVEQLPGGKTLTMDYSAPNRWRIRPTPNVTEIIVGTDVYMVTAGHTMKLPATYGAMIARKVHITMFAKPQLAQLRSTLRDLGTQSIDGKAVHVYRYVLDGVTQTWSIGANGLPVRAVLHGARGTVVLDYSRFNKPVNIQPPAT